MATTARKYVSFIIDWADMKPQQLAELVWELFTLTCTTLYFNKNQNYAYIVSYQRDFSHIEKKYNVCCHRGQVPPKRLIKEFIDRRKLK